jgi:hypothetical protein
MVNDCVAEGPHCRSDTGTTKDFPTDCSEHAFSGPDQPRRRQVNPRADHPWIDHTELPPVWLPALGHSGSPHRWLAHSATV